ncbi:MAG: hypothetical protein O3B31_05150 [Chloroflexi bacterium]|nr:hypothetical protein [Chloroflexota bacterium]
MVYAFREAFYDAWAPWHDLTASMRAANDGASGSGGEFARATLVGTEIFDRMTRRWEKPEFGLFDTIIDGEPVTVTVETAAERPFAKLLHFRREAARSDPRVLLLPPMSGHFATLTRGTIEGLLPHHDVYVMDWANARDVPLSAGTFDLDDYIEYVTDLVQVIGPAVHVIGICQAAVPALAAVT